jgi:hypothetical protein
MMVVARPTTAEAPRCQVPDPVATALERWREAHLVLDALDPDDPVWLDAAERMIYAWQRYRSSVMVARAIERHGSGSLREIPPADLASAGRESRSVRDDEEDAELADEMFESEEESHERGDTAGALEAWRDAEHGVKGSDPDSAEGHRLRDAVDRARDAFHDAEDAQRERHGEPRVERSDPGSS